MKILHEQKRASRRLTTALGALTAAGLAGACGGQPDAVDARPTAPAGQSVYALMPKSTYIVQTLAPLQGAKGAPPGALSSSAIASAVGADVIYEYSTVFPGFAARMTATEASALETHPDVARVVPDTISHPTTDRSDDFFALNNTSVGLWGKLHATGQGVVVGVVDTGIWPEHPSFADDGTLPPPPADWLGSCDGGDSFDPSLCNNKLIGARYYDAGILGFGFTEDDLRAMGEFISPRDAVGHGTHVSSTAAGNANIAASIQGRLLGTIGGMAPRAHIAMYKACWGPLGCAMSDLVAAIDTSAADGVDVLNYSIGGGATEIWTPDSISFLYASDQVFASVSAGNSGPGDGSIGNPAVAPWVTTVGASTHDRTFNAKVYGGSWSFFGASNGSGTPLLPLVDAANAGGELCMPGTLDPGLVAGKIVLCARGGNARVEKSYAVMLAGGAGMILTNTADSEDEIIDTHFVPSVHVSAAEGAVIKAYIASTAAPTAKIDAAVKKTRPGDRVAAFSSRGPNRGDGSLLKPDVTAPGVDILAGFSPTAGVPGETFGILSGTSMSAPHVTGVAALIRQVHPDWTPSMVKSALMTTATSAMLDETGAPATPHDRGSGRIVPNRAWEPQLVFPTSFNDFVNYFFGMPGDELNIPSVSAVGILDSRTVTRRVRFVGTGKKNFVPVISAPPGFSVSVSPTSMVYDSRVPTMKDGQFMITIQVIDRSVCDGTAAFGQLTWQNPTGTLRTKVAIPLVASCTTFAAPPTIDGAGGSGSTSFDVGVGYDGNYLANVHGLVPATVEVNSVVDDPGNDLGGALNSGVGATIHFFPFNPGTMLFRASLFDAEVDGPHDLDLYLFGPDTAGFPLVASSGSFTSEEQVQVQNPAPGLYAVVVHGYGVVGPIANYALSSWVVTDVDAGNLVVSGPAVVSPGTYPIGLSWAGLASARYLGEVSHTDGVGELARTIVAIDARVP
ncbi:MAG: S8 family peptidase [Deltaproteobacteria bacterium]|nr:S8 family peptidase [Deltaproteobacteria bacterium]